MDTRFLNHNNVTERGFECNCIICDLNALVNEINMMLRIVTAAWSYSEFSPWVSTIEHQAMLAKHHINSIEEGAVSEI